MTKIFRSGNGGYRTSDMFVEMNKSEMPAYWTLKPTDKPDYPSLKRLYLEMEDLTEFEFANEYLEGYEHWETMAKSQYLKEHIAQWRKELQLKVKARSLRGIIRDAVKENKYEANKFLITGGWIDKDEDKKGRGRPSKQDIKDELMKQAESQKELQEDLERLKGFN